MSAGKIQITNGDSVSTRSLGETIQLVVAKEGDGHGILLKPGEAESLAIDLLERAKAMQEESL